ncbi:MAG: DUF3363 domain-containing protein [Alphaproteobacteria bacterium]|nr:DUF3363 domain-containing protein [Alphaproteobacteria bacterium]
MLYLNDFLVKEMFLDSLNIDEVVKEDRPLVVTKDTPRKAYFKRLNLGQSGGKSLRRFRDSGVTLRGNSWAGNSAGQRVVVKINVVKNKARKINSAMNGGRVSVGGSGANLAAHIGYISRSGAGEGEEKAVLFDALEEGIDGKAFFERSRDDRHHFRVIISPENGSEIEDFREYVREVMTRAEKDLGTSLDWVSAVHYDTDDIHAHVVIRGRNDRGEDLVIARDYIAFGMRGRAQEVATELLGERSIDEIQKSIEKEVDALRVTSLDRFIEDHMNEERVVDVRKKNNFGKSQHYEQVIKGRLRYLESTGLATEYPPGVFTMEKDFRDVLYGIQNRADIVARLSGSFEEQELERLSLYSIKAGEGAVIEGFVKEKGFTDEITDKKYLVVEDMGQGLHYVPVGENTRADDLERGSLIRVKPGDRSSGKADYNINAIARDNGGVYRADSHMAYIEKEQGYIEPEDRQGYLDSHLKRLETLEQNGVVEMVEEGVYRVPVDVIKQGEDVTKKINERENKRFFPRIDILSKDSLDRLVGLKKKTWLDRELYKRSICKPSLSAYNDEIRSALEQRKNWLIDRDLAFIQSNGEFALRDKALSKLDMMEVVIAGEKIAQKLDIEFVQRKVVEGPVYGYVGYLTLESGHWGVVKNPGGTLQMAQLEEIPEIKERCAVVFEANEKGLFVMKQAQRQQEQQRSRDIDRGDEIER